MWTDPLVTSYIGGKPLTGEEGAGMVTLFTMGTSGNINHIDVSKKEPQKGHGEAARIGTVLADEVIKTYTRLRPLAGELRVSTSQVELALPGVTSEDLAKAQLVAAEVHAGKNPSFWIRWGRSRCWMSPNAPGSLGARRCR